MPRARSDSILIQHTPVPNEVTEVASLFHRHDGAMSGLQEASKLMMDSVDKIVRDDPDLYAALGGNDAARRMNPHITILQPPSDLKDLCAFRVCGGLDEGYKCTPSQSRDAWVGCRIGDVAMVNTSRNDDVARARDIIQNEWSDLDVLISTCLGMEALHVGFPFPLEIEGKLCFVNCGIELHEFPNNARGSEFTRAMIFLDTFKRSILPSMSLLKFATSHLREYICVDYPRKFVWQSTLFTVKNTFIDFKEPPPLPCVQRHSSSTSKLHDFEETMLDESTLKLHEMMNSIWTNSLTDEFYADIEGILNDIKAKVGTSRHSRGAGELGDDIEWIQEGQPRAYSKVVRPSAFHEGEEGVGGGLTTKNAEIANGGRPTKGDVMGGGSPVPSCQSDPGMSRPMEYMPHHELNYSGSSFWSTDGNTHGKGANEYPETHHNHHHHHQHSTVPYFRPHTSPELERPWRSEEEVATYDIREPVLFPSSPNFKPEHTQKVFDSHPQQWHWTKPEGADWAAQQFYGPAHTSTMNHNKNRPRLEEAPHSSYQRPYEENWRDITANPYYPQRPWNTTLTTTSAPNPQGKVLSVPDERTSAPHKVGSRVPTPQERYGRNPGMTGQKQAKEKKVIGCQSADESGGSTQEEYSECVNYGRFPPEGFWTSPSPGFPIGTSSSSSTQTSIKESPPGYRTCEDCRPSVFTRPAWGHNKNITTTRGEERPPPQQQHDTFALSTKNPAPGAAMTARTNAPMVGTPMAPHARAHIPNPRTQELVPTRVGTQHSRSVGKNPKTPIWEPPPPPLTSSGGKNHAHHVSTPVGKRDTHYNGLKEEQKGDTGICSTPGAPSGWGRQSESRMFTPNNAASSRVDSGAADASAGPASAIVEGSSAPTTQDKVEQPGLVLKRQDKVELHSFLNGHWLEGLKATVSNVFKETRNGGRKFRVRAQIVYDDPSLLNKQGYPMTVSMQNLRLRPKGRM